MLFREFRIFVTALIFFTRIPCSRWVKNPQEYLKDISRYFPLVGWLVGAGAACVLWGAQYLWPLPIAVILSLAASVLLTGALHEDGFMDVCDGFGGGWTKERILDIMKDSRVGAFGVLGMGLLAMLKLATLMTLPAPILPAVLFAGHSVSRFASISLLYTYDYARRDESSMQAHPHPRSGFAYTYDYARRDESSKAGAAVRKMTLAECFLAALWGVIPLVVLAGWPVIRLQTDGIVLLLLCVAAVWMTRWAMGCYFFHNIGGYTGDCLGAVQQVTEVVLYLVVAALLG